jgi:hypothetical protein
MVLLFTSSGVAQSATAGNQSTALAAEIRHTAKVKAEVQKTRMGGHVRVTLLEPPSEVKGLISTIRDDEFDVTREKTGETVAVPYSNVEKLRGPGLSKGAKIAIGVGIVVGVLVVIVAIVASHAKVPNVSL